ncbi:hypothetical protein [Shewanella waksmanii]|uniref:hypothetical protein n=1 Tax=Shewanella waksmanii TaxID=213783 RepID=UPI003735860D
MNKTALASITVVAVTLAAVTLYSQQQSIQTPQVSQQQNDTKPAPTAQSSELAVEKKITAPVSQTAPVEQRPNRVVNEDGFEQQVVQQRPQKQPVARPDSPHAPHAHRAPTQPPHSPEDYAYHTHEGTEKVASAPVSRPMPKPEQ